MTIDKKSVEIILVALILILTPIFGFSSAIVVEAQPSLKDPNLKVELVTKELASPTGMAFLDKNNILVIQKNDGTVRLISNGILEDKPILKVDIDNDKRFCCIGLLGIAILKITANNNNNITDVKKESTTGGIVTKPTTTTTSVFLYYTEDKIGKPIRNKVYRYEWNGETLLNPKLILDLPAEGLHHVGGKLTIGKDHSLYAVIGDLDREGELQNFKDGPSPDNTSVIFRVSALDGSTIKDNPFMNNNNNNNNSAIQTYYAYGIRNSFGLTTDPVTGRLWDTDNGDIDYDEINLVNPGFNGGWKKVMGPISRSKDVTEDQLVNLPGSKYADPVFSWKSSIGVTAIEFLNSSKLGEKYKDNVFVGDIDKGNLYYFQVNENRTGLKFDGSDSDKEQQQHKESGLSDLVADNKKEISEITLGKGFGGITDIKTSPNGLLYILTFDRKARGEGSGEGSIYRISSTSDNLTGAPR
jgi:glucose/arabinose dehydrogenase